MKEKVRSKRYLSKIELNAGVLIILIFALVASFAPFIAPSQGDSPYVLSSGSFSASPEPPSPAHPLGTLPGQYDVFYGLVWGAQVAFLVGFFTTLGRALAGILLGLLSGFFGGLLDAVLMRITDAFMAFPAMAAAAVMFATFGERPWLAVPGAGTILGGRNELIIMLTLVLFGWMQYARLVRANTLAEREKEYAKAAISIGASRPRILFRHLLPNVTRGLFVLIASDIGAMVAIVAAFYFIGLAGGRGSVIKTDWGQMLSISRDWIIGAPGNAFEYWYTYLPSSLAIVLFTFGWSLTGDGLRDLMDPRWR